MVATEVVMSGGDGGGVGGGDGGGEGGGARVEETVAEEKVAAVRVVVELGRR